MKIKFLADENLRRAIVLGVRRREPSASFIHAYEVGIAGKDDPTVLQMAATQDRVLVSHDIKTVPQHFRQFYSTARQPWCYLDPSEAARRHCHRRTGHNRDFLRT